MPVELFIALPIGLAILVAAIVAVVIAPSLPMAIRILAALVFTLMLLFCMFGFAAAMEPGDYHVIWRVVYVAVFLASLSAIGRLVFAKPQHRKVDQE